MREWNEKGKIRSWENGLNLSDYKNWETECQKNGDPVKTVFFANEFQATCQSVQSLHPMDQKTSAKVFSVTFWCFQLITTCLEDQKRVKPCRRLASYITIYILLLIRISHIQKLDAMHGNHQVSFELQRRTFGISQFKLVTCHVFGW